MLAARQGFARQFKRDAVLAADELDHDIDVIAPCKVNRVANPVDALHGKAAIGFAVARAYRGNAEIMSRGRAKGRVAPQNLARDLAADHPQPGNAKPLRRRVLCVFAWCHGSRLSAV